MNTNAKAKWNEIRSKGKGKFILIQGIFKSGVMFASLTTIAHYLIDYGFTYSKVGKYLFSGKTIFQFVFKAIVFGLLMGLINWHSNERQYKKVEENKI
jgi:hypothetical protein